MFNLFKINEEPQNPEQALNNIRIKIRKHPDSKKLKFITKHLDDVVSHLNAIMTDDQQSAHSADDQKKEREAKSYLIYRTSIFNALDDHPLARDISEAADYFLDHTTKKARLVFSNLFKTDPLSALNCARPGENFIPPILAGMETLTKHENPYLYFKCLDISGHHQDRRNLFFQRAAHQTADALTNLLDKNPTAFLMMGSADEQPSYLSYLPDDIYRQRFIVAHLDQIEDVCLGLEDITQKDIKALDKLCAHFVDGAVPERLQDLKKTMLSSCVKQCFTLAADGGSTGLSQQVRYLETQQHELIKADIYFNGSDEHVTFLRFTNPNVPSDAKDDDKGLDSKHLWLITHQKSVMAVAFDAMAMRIYLQHQRHHPAPSIEKFDQFAGLPSPKVA